MAEGIVYVLTNEAMPGLVKIGYTTTAIEVRLQNLYSTSVPFPFRCEFACHTEKAKALEEALHAAFAPDRVNPRREFFKLSLDRILPLLKCWDHPQTDVTQEVQKELETDVSEQEEAAERQYRKNRARFDFFTMGIAKGEEIHFDEGDTHATAIIHDAHYVNYQGEIILMTPLTRRLKGIPYNVNPLPYWTYRDKRLQEIYNEVYPFNIPPDEM